VRHDNDGFLGFLELNERAWGGDTYADRPKLEAILGAHVVAFWRSTHRRDPACRVTIHINLNEVHRYAAEMLIHSNTRTPDRRLMRLYVGGQRARIKGIKLILEIEAPLPDR